MASRRRARRADPIPSGSPKRKRPLAGGRKREQVFPPQAEAPDPLRGKSHHPQGNQPRG